MGLCKDCGEEVFVDTNMVMLNENLWENICDRYEDLICHECIEERMGRDIKVDDFKVSTTGDFMIPCNQMWMWENRKDEYLKIFPENKNL